MYELSDYDLKIRREKLMAKYQQYQASVDCMNGSADKSHCIPAVAANAQIAGRSVTQIDNASSSKEARLFQNYMNSTEVDRLRSHFVNTIKRTELHPKFNSLFLLKT